MKIAITGAAGFIGARLKAGLEAEGHDVAGLDLAGKTPVDIEDRDALVSACAGCGAIYHLAAAHRDDIFPRTRYYDVNVQGTKNVIHAAEKNNISKIIFTSSFAVYGLDAKTPDENSAPAPFNDYGKSKLEAEDALKDWAAQDPARSLTIVRPVVVFGEGNRGNVYTLIRQISAGKFVMIGQGENRKSMAYVENVAAFLKFCLHEKPGVQIYNYADKPDYRTKELTDVVYAAMGKKKSALRLPYALGMLAGYTFDVLARITGKSFPVSAVRVRKFCADTTSAAEKCRAAGFKPEFSLEDGIARMIAHDF